MVSLKNISKCGDTEENVAHDQCIAYYSPFPYRITPLSDSFPVVLNDYECKHGCRQYIVENPIHYKRNNRHEEVKFNPFQNCMIEKRNSDMKAILILSSKSLKTYLKYSGDFGINVVIITAKGLNYYINGHTNLVRNELVVLNCWNIIKRRFTDEPGSVSIDAFFEPRWKKHPNAIITMEVHDTYALKIITNSRYLFGMDPLIISHFATYLKVMLEPKLTTEDIVDVANEKGAFLLARRTSNQVYFPQTYPATIFSYVFIVPKPGLVNHWLQLIQVFEIPLWTLILLSALFALGYFWLEIVLKQSIANTPILIVLRLFLLQPLTNNETPRHFRPRIILALVLMLLVIYSSLFSSSVVTQMVMPKYEPGIKTEDDIEKHGMIKVFYTSLGSSLFDKAGDYFQDLEEVIKLVKYHDDLDQKVKSGAQLALQTFLTGTGLSLDLRIIYNANCQLLRHGNQWAFTHIMARNSVYASLIPELNDFILRCRETGLTIKWEWHMYREKFTMYEILRFLDYRPEAIHPRKLTLEIFQAPFWFLLIGMLLATCIFLVEIVCSWVEHSNGAIHITI